MEIISNNIIHNFLNILKVHIYSFSKQVLTAPAEPVQREIENLVYVLLGLHLIDASDTLDIFCVMLLHS